MLFRYRYDTETGLYYLNSRYYNPEWGRFINSDAIAGQVGVLLSHNVFAYCSNNPISLKDDTGFLACSAADGVSDGGTSDRNVGDKPVGGSISSGNLAQRLKAFKGILKTKFIGSSTGKAYNGVRNPNVDFKNGTKLQEHFKDHGGDFEYETSDEYLEGARNFVMKQPTSTTKSFVSKHGTYFRYDTSTNEFGIVNQYGGISTYFKPADGLNYWYEQIKLYK